MYIYTYYHIYYHTQLSQVNNNNNNNNNIHENDLYEHFYFGLSNDHVLPIDCYLVGSVGGGDGDDDNNTNTDANTSTNPDTNQNKYKSRYYNCDLKNKINKIIHNQTDAITRVKNANNYMHNFTDFSLCYAWRLLVLYADMLVKEDEVVAVADTYMDAYTDTDIEVSEDTYTDRDTETDTETSINTDTNTNRNLHLPSNII